ncbi:MAG: 1-acyl-sn-glycerol-3-phosphate acyltransferase [Lachnospiraceae bacterium]|nr:1-acyl-sn-glycerol-3-phosphate acyltransferase [Lachnospiraceae bacterium]
MRKNKQLTNWILNAKQESLLSIEERRLYYQRLREYCKNRKLTNTTPMATKIGPLLKKTTGAICRKLCIVLAGGDVEVVTDGLENIPKEPVIFASTHQGILDNFVWIPDCPKHAIIFHGAEVKKWLLFAQINTGLILVSRNHAKKENRLNAKLDMISLLLYGHSVFICPEGIWNLSPNRLYLPLNWGIVDIAQKAEVPIVPVVIENTHDTSNAKERITKVHIRYGSPVIVKETDELSVKLEEYKEKISTIRWELIEEKGLYLRRNITNMDYINFIEGNMKNLKMGGINIELENERIQGANQDFFEFHHINNVPWDAWGELLETEEVRKIKRINKEHEI